MGIALTGFAQQTVNKSFSGVKSISISLASGDCTLKRGNTNSVEVDLTHTYDEDRFEAIFEQNGSKLQIKEKFKSGTSSGMSKWTLTIPNGLDINLNAGSGDLNASELSLDLRSNTGSGDIDLTDMQGDIMINTGSGDVDAENQDGSLKVNTGSGDVSFSGQGEVGINAGSGDIYVRNAEAQLSINTGSGNINARSVTITGPSSFNSGSGDAEVSLQASLDHDISVNVGSGDAVLDFNNNEIAGNIVMKADKDRGDIEAPFKFDKVEEERNGKNTTVVKTKKLGNKDIRIQVSVGSGTAEISK